MQRLEHRHRRLRGGLDRILNGKAEDAGTRHQRECTANDRDDETDIAQRSGE
jgi:hypothetical protein